jgi:hypothetical protein
LSSRALIVIRKAGSNHCFLEPILELGVSKLDFFLEPTLFSLVSEEAIARVN